MGKIPTKYLKTHPTKIIEEGFNVERHEVSEALFSLSNEYSGVRGFFEEGSSFKNTLVGSYFNGIYDYSKSEMPTGYRGIPKLSHFMINSVNYFKVNIEIDGVKVDLKKTKFKDFYRELDLETGLMTRLYTVLTKDKKEVTIVFERFLSMINVKKAFQRISFKSNSNVSAKLTFLVDNKNLTWDTVYWKEVRKIHASNNIGILSKTLKSKQLVLSLSRINNNINATPVYFEDKNSVSLSYNLTLVKNTTAEFTRYVANVINRENLDDKGMEEEAFALLNESSSWNFDRSLVENRKYFKSVYARSDIEILGNDEDQQGIRYCIFMLETTYHGYSEKDNIGAKGLTGQAYSGHAFWDSETYCLPFYLFTNLEAAKSLIMFRYNTLKEAKERARQLDCRGACYPIATLNGKEAAQLWQHTSTQFQPTTAVIYALWHYLKLSDDVQFVKDYGLEICLEASRFLMDRGQWDSDHQYFSFYGVMGPDEFKVFVSHNVYTNIMAQFTFDFTLNFIKNNCNDEEVALLLKKTGLSQDIFSEMKEKSAAMKILYDDKTKLFEQNEGFFKLPHIDIHSIPQEDFPLYHSWTYDRIYRYDMIKQPDVLMFIFLFMTQYDIDVKKANYDYYEPHTIHESSLSPSIHSIFASELGYDRAAEDFFSFASRLDLDDYNRNTKEGLHLTSIAAAWMNIVYGFGGLRSDGDILELNPTLPTKWDGYSFNFEYKGAHLRLEVKRDGSLLKNLNHREVIVKIRGRIVTIKDEYAIK